MRTMNKSASLAAQLLLCSCTSLPQACPPPQLIQPQPPQSLMQEPADSQVEAILQALTVRLCQLDPTQPRCSALRSSDGSR